MSKKKIRKPYAGQNNMKNHEAELIALIIIFNTVCAHEEDYAKIKKIMLIKIKFIPCYNDLHNYKFKNELSGRSIHASYFLKIYFL